MPRFLTPRLLLLALAHFSIDAYSSFFAPLLPLVVARFHMSLTLVGALVGLASITSSFAQPLWGWVSDRLHRPWFVLLGPLVAAVFMSAVGLAPSFGWLVAVLMLGGCGSAAFHPQAAVLAAEESPRRSLAMSFFVSGGSLGFSFGPVFAVAVVHAFGLARSWIAALPGVVVVLLLVRGFARWTPRPRAVGPRPALAELRPVLRPLVLLYLSVVCRSAVSMGFMTFLPIYLHGRGWSVAAGGSILAVYLMLGALGGFFGGWLADRWDGRRVVVLSYLGALPLYLAFLLLPDRLGLPCLVAGSFVMQAALPVNVVLGQELSPRHSSTISSLLMGAAWGVGALLVGPIGALADARGLGIALATLSTLLLVGTGCAFALPRTRHAAPLADLAAPAVAVD